MRWCRPARLHSRNRSSVSTQIPNSAGGHAWAVNDWQRLDRALVLGSVGGTYYISERQLTLENAQALLRVIETDGPRAVRRTVEVSEAGFDSAVPAVMAEFIQSA